MSTGGASQVVKRTMTLGVTQAPPVYGATQMFTLIPSVEAYVDAPVELT